MLCKEHQMDIESYTTCIFERKGKSFSENHFNLTYGVDTYCEQYKLFSVSFYVMLYTGI